jgi:molybdate transport system ATP-binding protein
VIEIDIQKELHGANGNILLDINLQIANHSFVALSGDSGSGKTTLLRAIAGLESARGSIIVDGKIWQDDKTTLRVQDRGIGFVFQDYALFDNMSVIQNLLYANKDISLANKLLNMTNLTALKDRLPHTLSGGQKQRVSLCRAMMNRPKLLLLDEPLSALDVSMRVRLQNEILSLHKEFGTTTIMVSHEPSEIYKLSNRVVILNSGKIVDDGDAKDVLLKSNGSAKFSFEGEILDIISVDIINVAIIAIGQQIVEVVISNNEANNLKVGQIVNVGTKAFSPTITI